MTRNDGFGRRLSKAIGDWEDANYPTRLTDAALGEMVGKALRRDAYRSQAVNRWRNGQEPETLATITAIAQVLGVSAGWLAFGQNVNQNVNQPEVAPNTEPLPSTALRSVTRAVKESHKKKGRTR